MVADFVAAWGDKQKRGSPPRRFRKRVESLRALELDRPVTAEHDAYPILSRIPTTTTGVLRSRMAKSTERVAVHEN